MNKPDIRVVLGKGGSGKSTLTRAWVEQLRGRVLIFDSAAEPGYAQGAEIVEDQGELVRVLLGGFDPIRICYRDTMPGAFERFNRVAWAAEDATLVWEEVDRWCDAGRLAQWAFAIVNQGRHRNLRVIATARRPARVSRDLTANASRIVAFATREPRDLRYLAEYVGEEAAAKIPGMAPFHALDWTEATGARVRPSPFR